PPSPTPRLVTLPPGTPPLRSRDPSARGSGRMRKGRFSEEQIINVLKGAPGGYSGRGVMPQARDQRREFYSATLGGRRTAATRGQGQRRSRQRQPQVPPMRTGPRDRATNVGCSAILRRTCQAWLDSRQPKPASCGLKASCYQSSHYKGGCLVESYCADQIL